MPNTERFSSGPIVEHPLSRTRNLLGAPCEEAARHRLVRLEHVQLRHFFVRKQLDRMHESRESPVNGHFVQARERFVDAWRRDGALLHRTQAMRTGFEEADSAGIEVKLRAVPVLPRRP